MMEITVRLLGFESTYIEERSGWYQSSYQQNMDDPMRVHRHYKEFWMETPEYRFHRTVNSHGFADEEFRPKQNGALLIQTYGDSFTEGDGAPTDSAYPAILSNVLVQDGWKNTTVQNFGKSGSDPGFYWRQLKDVGISMQPDVVIMTYGSMDFTADFFTRGGLDRFHDNRWSAFRGPWWEFIYASSHLFRWFARILFSIDESGFLTTPSQQEVRFAALKPRWNAVFDSISTLARAHNFNVLLVKKPERSEIDLGAYQYDFQFFDAYLKHSEGFLHFDLLDYYVNEKQLTRDSTQRYYWVKDGHHNPRGYNLMAEAIAQKLQQNLSALIIKPEDTSRQSFDQQ